VKKPNEPLGRNGKKLWEKEGTSPFSGRVGVAGERGPKMRNGIKRSVENLIGGESRKPAPSCDQKMKGGRILRGEIFLKKPMIRMPLGKETRKEKRVMV